MNTYYENTLYPLQDNVLAVIDEMGLPFYLTGGTALSRCHYYYRYSDDLDFFVNNDSHFQQYTKDILRQLDTKDLSHITNTQSDTYVSVQVQEILRVDFVNDVVSHIGELIASDIFSRTDNIKNILSNKITALTSRDEPKDVVDLWMIHNNMTINWEQVFTDVRSKAVGILPPDVAQKLETFPPELLDQIQWIEGKKPKEGEFTKDIQTIISSMLQL